MPKKTRLAILNDYRRYFKSVIDSLAACEGGKNFLMFQSELKQLTTFRSMLQTFQQEVDEASDGYSTAKAARRAIWEAARELDVQIAFLDEAIEAASSLTSIEQVKSSNIVNRLLNIYLQLGRIRFAPDMPRQRITRAQIAEIEQRETSAMEHRYSELNKPPQAGALGDAQLASLANILDEEPQP